MNRRPLLLRLVVAGCLIGPAPASGAAIFVDLYLGAAATSDADIDVQLLSMVPPQDASRQADFDPSGVLGGRLGAWSERLPWLGLAVDISAYRADSEIADLSLVPLSLLLMLRWPLAPEPDLPGGRFQPYLGLGPSLVHYDFEVDLRPAVAKRVSDDSITGGWDFRAGLAWQFHPRFALFGEYRYLHFRIDYEQQSQGWILGLPITTVTEVEANIDTHQLLAGLSLRF